MLTALVIGATGMVGSQLVEILLRDERFSRVIIFVRRSMNKQSSKLEEHIINFDKIAEWSHLIQGDILFSALGTTLKQAGSKPAQYKIDHTYQLEFAQIASNNGVPNYVLISSSGANPKSMIFYSRMKGELEEDVRKLPFYKIAILQPGLLTGQRKEERIGEKIGYYILTGLNKVGLFKQYRPVPADVVARAMINSGLSSETGTRVIAMDEIFSLGESKLH